MTRKEQDALLAQSGMPNKWLRFYMRYLLLFQIIFAFVPMVLFIPLLLPLISDNPLLLLQFTVILTMAVLAILSYYYSLRGLSFKAYCWNFAYLCYIPAAYTEYLIAIASSRYALNSVISIGLFIAPRLLLCILWIVPNIIYLRKRRQLFRTYSKEQIAAAVENYQARLYMELDETAAYWKAKQDAAEKKQKH